MDQNTNLDPAAVRRSLLDSLVRAAELKAEWGLLARRAQENTMLPRGVRLAIKLVARQARVECNDIADSVMNGIDCLEDGAIDAGVRSLRSCEACLDFIEGADRTVAALVRNSHREGGDGN